MDFEELREIEKQFNLKLPSEYVKFILAYPTLPDSQDQKYLEERILRNASLVVSYNEFFREELLELVPETFDTTLPWGKHFLLVGSDGCGNYYFLDTTQSPAPVHFFDHETGELEYLAADIHGLYKHFIDTSNEVKSWKSNEN